MSATDLQFHQKRRFDQLGYYNLIKKLLEILYQIETADGCIINFLNNQIFARKVTSKLGLSVESIQNHTD